MDVCKAIVQKVIPKGPHGPYAVATAEGRPDIVGSIAFSLEPTVWEDKDWPEEGSVVFLGKLRLKRAGWRSKEGRFWTPSDEQPQQRARSNLMNDISLDDMRRRCEAEGIDPTKAWALMPRWTESGPRVEGTKSALVSPDLILRSNGTVVILDKLLWPWSHILAEKHVTTQSNPEGLPWDEFVGSVTKMESDSFRIAREIMERGQGGTKTPYPYYAGDTGWSWDRDQRSNKLTAIWDQDKLYTKPAREMSKEWLMALRSLINETEEAVRNNLETRSGMTWIEQSKFVQGLFYQWYLATRDRLV